MAAPNYIDQIQDYLAGDLNSAERTAFEKALVERPDLKQAVTLWQDLDEVLAPAPEDQLLENIARLRAERKETSPKTTYLPWLIGAVVLALMGLLAWGLWPKDKATTQANETVAPQTQTPPAFETDTQSLRLEAEQPAETETRPEELPPPVVTPPSPSPKMDDENEEEEARPPVFAANYDPNPLIEDEMTDQLRGGELSLELTEPAENAKVETRNGVLDLRFSGKITTDLDQEDLTIRVLLFSNTTEDYQQGNYITELTANLAPAESGFELTAAGTIELQPGLYYYFIEWEEEEAYLLVGRLLVEAGG